jgi:hypothetical protein
MQKMTSTSLQGVTILKLIIIIVAAWGYSNLIWQYVFLPPSGYRVRLRQIRDGLELPPITGDNNYDPTYQEYRRFQNVVHVHRVSIVKSFILPRSAFIRLCRLEFLKHIYMSTTNIWKPEVMGTKYQADYIPHEFSFTNFIQGICCSHYQRLS